MGDSKKVFVSQVVFPSELVHLDEPALLIGWNTEQFQCAIASAIPIPTSSIESFQSSSSSLQPEFSEDFYAMVTESLKYCYEDPNFILSRHRHYPYRPIVLGLWLPKRYASMPGNDMGSKYHQSSIWITMTSEKQRSSIVSRSSYDNDHQVVKILSLFSLGSRYETSIYLIAFDSVNTDRLHSINVMDPMLAKRPHQQIKKGANSSARSRNGNHQTLDAHQAFKKESIANAKSGRKSPETSNMPEVFMQQECIQFWRKKTELEDIALQINASHDLRQITLFYLQKLHPNGSIRCNIPVPLKRTRWVTFIQVLSRPFQVLLKWTSMLQRIIQRPMPWLTETLNSFTWQNLFPTRESPMEQYQSLNSSNSNPLSQSLSSNSRVDQNILNSNEYFSLKDTSFRPENRIESFLFRNFTVYGFSFFLCELNERVSQLHHAFMFCGLFALVWNVDAVYKTKLYLHVQSIVIFVVIDMFLGIIVGYLIYIHAKEIVFYITMAMSYFKHKILYSTLEWFNHAPGGIKLNPLITRKIGSGIIMFVEDTYCLVFGSSYNSMGEILGKPMNEFKDEMKFVVDFVEYFGCMGGIGFSLELALIADLFSLLTMPITILHMFFAFIIKHHSQFIYSLWLLFSGQKKNILRKRVDTCEYDREQLLIGMILFTVATFVWPSFCAYYLLLALVRIFVLILVCFPWQFVVILREFPYLPLYIYCMSKAKSSVTHCTEYFTGKTWKPNHQRDDSSLMDRIAIYLRSSDIAILHDGMDVQLSGVNCNDSNNMGISPSMMGSKGSAPDDFIQQILIKRMRQEEKENKSSASPQISNQHSGVVDDVDILEFDDMNDEEDATEEQSMEIEEPIVDDEVLVMENLLRNKNKNRFASSTLFSFTDHNSHTSLFHRNSLAIGDYDNALVDGENSIGDSVSDATFQSNSESISIIQPESISMLTGELVKF
jgi:xanthosine utilization system XapX-like protein